MKPVENKFGKQRLENAELGTENRKTHDVKPRTENSEQGTAIPHESNSSNWTLWLQVAGVHFSNLSRNKNRKKLRSYALRSGCPQFTAGRSEVCQEFFYFGPCFHIHGIWLLPEISS